MKLPIFNALRAGYCTCPLKYNIDPCLGRCTHQCIYCYAGLLPSFIGPASPRLKLLNQIENMARNTKLKHPVIINDCT